MTSMHPIEKKILLVLKEGETIAPDEIASASGLDLSSVMRGLDWLSAKGLVSISESVEEYISLGAEGVEYVESGLPERRVAELLKTSDYSTNELREKMAPALVGIAIGWLRKKEMADFKDGKLRLTEKGSQPTPDEELLILLKKGTVKRSEIDPVFQEWIKPLASRKNVIKVEEKISREIRLTEKGAGLLTNGITESDEIGQLTSEMLKNGDWAGRSFRRYDVESSVAAQLSAKSHPMTRMIEEIADIFVSMGFEEISGPIVESNFWNFDALFVPQDHPAREMQDTFYLEKPGKAELPSSKIVDSVSSVHGDGGETGSSGWGYKWDPHPASKTLLRTHTTSTTIRRLAEGRKPPIKVYSIGRVFRNERISYKHLPEFHQIEGIVAGDVSFKNLLAILKEFYGRMGFDKIRFRPAYFPYTEPSLEVEVYFEQKKSWIELGGAGIFRPEVTEPLGITYPVLAWGLGLERLAMLRLDLTDIRALYRSDIDWLRSLPL